MNAEERFDRCIAHEVHQLSIKLAVLANDVKHLRWIVTYLIFPLTLAVFAALISLFIYLLSIT